LRAFLTPIRAGSPLIGQSYFAEPLLSTLRYAAPMKFLEDWISTQHEQKLAA
jgi:hypothetical protein